MGTNQRYTSRMHIQRGCKRIVNRLDECLDNLKSIDALYEGKDPKYRKFVEDYAGLLTLAQKTIEQFRIEMV